MKPQFDNRYRIEPRVTDNPGVRKRSRIVAHQQAEALARLRRRPANIRWFESALEGERIPAGAPVIGYFCNMIPTELVTALGAVPRRLDCGNAALVQPGEEILSGEICPLAKASFASVMDPEGPAGACRALVLPASCDAKKKLGEILSDYKPVFVLNLPPEQDSGAYLAAAAAEVERLADFLSATLGRRLSAGALAEAIRAGQKRAARVRELQDLRAARPGALSVRDFFIVIQASFAGADPAEWQAETEKVLAEAREYSPDRGRIRPRLILTGAPMLWPNFKVLTLIEECGADVVADTLCSGAQSCFDPVVIDEPGRRALFRALASRYLFASPCPCFISQASRLARVLDLVETCKADGVINYCLRLCQLFDLETYRLSRVLKDRRIPFHTLRTDYSLEDTEQLRVRLEAFLETLHA